MKRILIFALSIVLMGTVPVGADDQRRGKEPKNDNSADRKRPAGPIVREKKRDERRDDKKDKNRDNDDRRRRGDRP